MLQLSVVLRQVEQTRPLGWGALLALLNNSEVKHNGGKVSRQRLFCQTSASMVEKAQDQQEQINELAGYLARTTG